MPHQFLGSGFPKKIEGHQVSMYEQGALVLSSGLKNGDGAGRAEPVLLWTPQGRAMWGWCLTHSVSSSLCHDCSDVYRL